MLSISRPELSSFEMKTIREIKKEYKECPDELLESFCHAYKDDKRSGVIQVVSQCLRKIEALKQEYERLDKMLFFERKYKAFSPVCGIDEAGRGPLFGPVVSAAVILKEEAHIKHVNDSKKLTPKMRAELFDIIQEEAVAVGVGISDAALIDEINILNATYEAMRQAVSNLKIKPGILINDAVIIKGISDIKQVGIVKGDEKSQSIAAASIIAKVTRDRMLDEYDKQFPEYGFSRHKGYGTSEHFEAIRKYGLTPFHRKTFIPDNVG